MPHLRNQNQHSFEVDKTFLYQTVFATANDGFFLLDERGVFLESNPKGASMYGLPVEALIGRSPLELSPETQADGRPSSEAFLEKYEGVMRGAPQFFEWRSLRADGMPFDVEITLSRIELQGKFCLHAVVRDVTERVQQRRQLALLEYAINHIREAAYLIDDQRNLVYVNEEVCRALGYSREE